MRCIEIYILSSSGENYFQTRASRRQCAPKILVPVSLITMDSHTAAPNKSKSVDAIQNWIPASRLSLSELQLGKVLGSGSFCKIREVTGYRKSQFHEYENVNRGKSNYVIKQLRNGMTENDMAIGLDDLHSEAELLEKISHPNAIQFHSAAIEAEKDCRFYIMLELIDITLEQQIKTWQFKRDNRKDTIWNLKHRYEMKALWTERIKAACAISSVMKYLHGREIIYRDLKPQNIGFNNRKELKLFDFGLAKELDPKDTVGDNYKMTGLSGSMRYMAPEVFNEKKL